MIRLYHSIIFLLVGLKMLAGVPVYICQTGSTQLNPQFAFTTPDSVKWYGNSGISYLSSTQVLNPFFGNAPVGSYPLFCVAWENALTDTAYLDVFVCNAPQINLTAVNDTVCSQGVASLTAAWNGGNPSCSLQLQWSTSNGLSWNNLNGGSAVLHYCSADTATQSFTSPALPSGIYLFRVIDSCTAGCNSVISNTVNVFALDPPEGISTSKLICSDNNFSFLPLSSNYTQVHYTWTGPFGSGTDIITGNIHNASTVNATYLYQVIPAVAGCTGQPFTDTIVVRPAISGIPFSGSVCNGTAISYTPLSNIPQGVSYIWQRTVPSVTTGQDTIKDILQNAGQSPLLYSYTIIPVYIDSPQCIGSPFTASYTVHPSPIGNDTGYTACSEQQITLNLSATQPAGFSWQSGTNNGTGNSIIIPPVNVSGDSLITFSIIPVSDSGCIGPTFSNTLTLHALPGAPQYVLWADTVCLQSSGVILSVQPFADFSYNWNFNPPVPHNMVGQTAVVFSTPATGNSIQVLIEVTNNNTGCKKTYPRKVNLNNSTAPAIGNIILTHSNELIYTDNTPYTYQWGYDDSALNSTVLTGETFQSYSAGNTLDTNNRFYWVIINDNNGCITKCYFNNPGIVSNISDKSFGYIKPLRIFPNPSVNGWFTIDFKPDELKNMQITVYDMRGGIVKHINEKSFYLSQGLYTVLIENGHYIFRKTLISIE